MVTIDGSNEELTNEVHSHHHDVSRIINPKDKELSVEPKQTIKKRNSDTKLQPKGTESINSKNSNNDLINVIESSKIINNVGKNPSKLLLNKSINAQTPMVDGVQIPAHDRVISGLDVITLKDNNLRGSPENSLHEKNLSVIRNDS
jgi:hypothetical protein